MPCSSKETYSIHMLQVSYSDKQTAPAFNMSSCLMLIICKQQMYFSSEHRESDFLRILNRKWVSPSANVNLKEIPYCTHNICSIKHIDFLAEVPRECHNLSVPLYNMHMFSTALQLAWETVPGDHQLSQGTQGYHAVPRPERGRGKRWTLLTPPPPSCISGSCFCPKVQTSVT